MALVAILESEAYRWAIHYSIPRHIRAPQHSLSSGPGHPSLSFQARITYIPYYIMIPVPRSQTRTSSIPPPRDILSPCTPRPHVLPSFQAPPQMAPASPTTLEWPSSVEAALVIPAQILADPQHAPPSLSPRDDLLLQTSALASAPPQQEKASSGQI